VRKFLRWTAISLVSLVLLIVIGVGGFLLLGIPVELSGFRAPVEKAASLALGRTVTIDGSVSLAPSLEPTLQIEKVHIANEEGWSATNIVSLGLARVQLSVVPLLKGRVEVAEIAVESLQVNLEIDADGTPNWLTDVPKKSDAGDGAPATGPEKQGPLRAFEIAVLDLQDLSITLKDGVDDKTYELKLDSITGSAIDNQPMRLEVEGSAQQVPYTIALTTGSLAHLLQGGEPWDVALEMSALGASLDVKGTVAEPLRGIGADLAFTLGGDDLQDLDAFVGADLPPIDGYELTGQFTDTGERFALSDLSGRIGQGAFSGSLELDVSQELPVFTGKLDVPLINLEPVAESIRTARAAGPAQDNVAPDDNDTAALDPEAPFLNLDFLRVFEGRFDMTVGEITGGATTVRDASLSVQVQDGRLSAPIGLTFADVGFTGEFVLDGAGDTPGMAVNLTANETNIGDLARVLAGFDGIDGGFKQATLALAVEGETLKSLIQGADFEFTMTEAALSYGNEPGATPIDFALESAEMRLPAGQDLAVSATGSVLKESFTLKYTSGDIEQVLTQAKIPLALVATGGGAELRASGTLARLVDGDSSVEFELEGERIGGLSRWVGVSPDAEARYSLRGTVALSENAILVEPLDLQLGESALSGKLGSALTGTDRINVLALEIDKLDLDELAGLFPAREEAPSSDDQDEAFTIDVPLLPQGIEFEDTDLDLTIAVLQAGGLAIEDVSVSSRVRDGRVQESPFGAVVAGARFDGSLSLDLTTRAPAAGFTLAAEDMDIGRFISELGVGDGLQASAGRLSVELDIAGATARDMLGRSRVTAKIADGRWVISDPNLEGTLTIGIPEGTISAAPGDPITLVLDGLIEQEPIKIRIVSERLETFTDPVDRLPMTLDVALADANLRLEAAADLPIERRKLEFKLSLNGKSLDSFDRLLEVSLPPLGPYALAGDFAVRPNGYFVTDLALRVGDSDLTGSMGFETSGIRPSLDVDLNTATLQLDDFKVGDWTPLVESDEPSDVAEAEAADEEEDKAIREQLDEARALLTPEVMRSLDASLNVTVEEVLSGKDELGSGTLETTLADGRFEVAPLILNIPGGSAEVFLAYEPTETAVLAEARAKVEQLDYGVLARRIDPESEVGGYISVDINLSSQADHLERVMARANGQLDFAIWPKDLNADLFDLWAVNLVTAVLPSVDSEDESTFNCIIARFKIVDGVMEPEAILVDSTLIQASGEGKVDFRDETVDFTFAPRSKRPQMFSANTPVAVNGDFEDFGVGIAPGGLIGTVFRFTTSPVTTPFQWVFSTPVAADGKAACAEAWAREPEEMLEEVKGPETEKK